MKKYLYSNTYLEAERKRLFLLLGYFNIVAFCVSIFWLKLASMGCRSYENNYVIRPEWLLFGLLIYLVFILIETIHRLRFQNDHKMAFHVTLKDSFLNNLPGIPIYLFCLAINQGQFFCLLLGFYSVYLSRLALLKRQRKNNFKITMLGIFREHQHTKTKVFLFGIFFVVAYLASLSNLGPTECSSTSSIKANMHTVQTELETYAKEHNGNYPESLEVLQTDAQQKGYWKKFTNPYGWGNNCDYFLGQNCTRASYQLYLQLDKKTASRRLFITDFLGFPMDLPTLYPHVKYWNGMVLYEFIPPNHYRIYGTDKQGEIIQDKGQDFYLSDIN